MKKKTKIFSQVALSLLVAGLALPAPVLAQEDTTTTESTTSTELLSEASIETTVAEATTTTVATETTSALTTAETAVVETTQVPTTEVSTTTTTQVSTEEPTAVQESATAVPIYRLYNKNIGKHIYTTDENEKNVLYNQHGWGYEGIAWYAATNGTPVYRLYNPALKNHLYTQDKNEVSVLTSQHGWRSDNAGKPVFYSNGKINVYRLYNKGLQGRHHWTTDTNEYKVLPQYGWRQESVKFKALAFGKPIRTQYKNNSTSGTSNSSGYTIPSGSSTIANTASKMTIEADVSLSGTGTGNHAKLVIVSPVSGVSFGLQYDAHARAPHTGKTSFMIENIGHNNAGGQAYQWTNLYARPGVTYRLMLTLQNDGTYAGYINGAKVVSGRNAALAGRTDLALRVEGAARKTGDTLNAKFTNIKLKNNGSYQASRQWTATPQFNINNGIITKINGETVPRTAAGARTVTSGITISGRLTGLPSSADWDTAGYFDKVSGLVQFY